MVRCGVVLLQNNSFLSLRVLLDILPDINKSYCESRIYRKSRNPVLIEYPHSVEIQLCCVICINVTKSDYNHAPTQIIMASNLLVRMMITTMMIMMIVFSLASKQASSLHFVKCDGSN